MNISVSELIVRYLERLGIDHIFGMPGAHVLPIYDRLHDSSVKSVLVKHEQGAAFMAGGYARVQYFVTEGVQFDPAEKVTPEMFAEAAGQIRDLATAKPYLGMMGNVEKNLRDMGRIK